MRVGVGEAVKDVRQVGVESRLAQAARQPERVNMAEEIEA
jgi:hypothetical protein